MSFPARGKVDRHLKGRIRDALQLGLRTSTFTSKHKKKSEIKRSFSVGGNVQNTKTTQKTHTKKKKDPLSQDDIYMEAINEASFN
jgi:hypothetical protein